MIRKYKNRVVSNIETVLDKRHKKDNVNFANLGVGLSFLCFLFEFHLMSHSQFHSKAQRIRFKIEDSDL